MINTMEIPPEELPALDLFQNCRLCLAKEKVSVDIFSEGHEVRVLYYKIMSCLPVHVTQDDKLPRKICTQCNEKVDNFYQFWTLTAKTQKTLLDWSEKKDALPAIKIKTENVAPPGEVSFKQETMDYSDDDNDRYDDDQSEDDLEPTAMVKVCEETDENAPAGGAAGTSAATVKLEEDDKVSPYKISGFDMDPQQIEFDSDLTCQYCGLILSNKSTWSSHSQTCKERTTKAEESEWCCFRCGVVKSNEEQLRGHQRWCGKFRCYKCGETKQNEAALKVHRRRCFEKKIYKCNSCKRSFRAKSAMIEHAAQHINENLPCDFCAKTFESKGKLERHIREVHFKIRNRSVHTCTICSKNFKSKSNLKNHLNIHTGEKNHLCYLCGSRFVDPGTLRKHMRHVHAETRSGQPVQMLQCEKCGKSFGSRTGYARHVDKIHGNGKPECTICGKRVSGNEMLRVHMNAAHNKVKPYECKTCGGLYTTPNYLKVHMRIHSGENFQCRFCKKTFLQVACLNRHLKLVHPDAENRDSGASQSSL